MDDIYLYSIILFLVFLFASIFVIKLILEEKWLYTYVFLALTGLLGLNVLMVLISWDPIVASLLPGVGTSLASYVALFKEEIKNEIHPPELPELIILPSTNEEVKDSPYFITVKSKQPLEDAEGRPSVRRKAYIRIGVKNVGKGVAKNVQVFFDGIGKTNDVDMNQYKCLPLREGYTQKVTKERLFRGPPSIWDICYVIEEGSAPPPDETPVDAYLRFKFNFIPNELKKLYAGTYKFKIYVTHDNLKNPIEKEFQVAFDPDFVFSDRENKLRLEV